MKTCCRKYLKAYAGNLGMRACLCGRAWYHFSPGWAKPYDGDRIYRLGEYAGTPVFYGDLQVIVTKRGPCPVPRRTPAPGELFA
jgi:hypothetical protein